MKTPPIERPVEGAADAPPLFLPDEPFPPYRFVPGHAPHPVAHADGYLHGVHRPPPPYLERERWRDNAAYLRGFDFFNRAWWWEAHESWEELWHVVEGKDDAQHALLKGLIQLAACALNRERASDRGADRLIGTACEELEKAERLGAVDGRLCGLDLAAVREEAGRHLAKPTARVDGFYLVPR